MEYIFIIGPSAVGKTTLARKLHSHYGGVYLEQNMVPEFSVPQDAEDPGLFEEQLCWDNVLLQLRFFRGRGFEPVVALDFDDWRARELPLLFRGSRFIILRLVSRDPEQIRRQMLYRRDHEGGLFAPEQVERSNRVIMERPLLPNEVMIDVAGKSPEEVFGTAVEIIDRFEPATEYAYRPGDGHGYLSWVRSRGLR